VSFFDVDDLAAAVVATLGDPAARERHGRRAQADVQGLDQRVALLHYERIMAPKQLPRAFRLPDPKRAAPLSAPAAY